MGAVTAPEREHVERPGEGRAPRRRPSRVGTVAVVAAVVAVVSALLMPLAPVSMSMPTVSWPQDPAAPVSTGLQLTAQRPLGMDVSFSCAALSAAADGGNGVLLSTVLPGRASETEGLLIRAERGVLSIVSGGTEVHRGAVPVGGCGYALELSPTSTRLLRDGAVLVDLPFPALPDVDVLATSVTTLPGADGADLSVQVAVDDQFSTSPTTAKWLLTALLVASSATVLVLLFRRDRRAGPAVPAPSGRRSRFRGVTLADAAVVLVLLGWLFVAPMTDDDGYYAAMARSSIENGYVGNYYQLFNQGYTPFTWFYQLLGYWELLVGSSPVMLRIPALVAGLLTYALVRAVVASVVPRPGSAGRRLGRSAVVAVVFAAAWLPFSMGVRPESVVGLLAVSSLAAVLVARRRASLAWFALSLVLAGLAITCHPTGVVALAPWLAGLPSMWPLIRGATVGRTLARALCVVAPAAVSAVPGFLDGSLNDFLRSDEIFEEWPNSQWYDEWLRYQFLLSDNPMGNYAKRAIVLVGIVVLVWSLVLLVLSAGRRTTSWPPALVLTTASYGLGLLLLSLTPSKWTHHFGSLAGTGAVFISCCLLYLGRSVVAAGRGRSIAPAVTLAGISLVLAFALAMHGPNWWPYSWMLGMPQAFERPHLGPLALDSPALWAVALLALAAVVAVRTSRRRRSLARVAARTGTAAVVAFLTAVVAYTLGGTAYATAVTAGTYSPPADALRDPLASDCGPQGAVTAPDPATARTLVPLAAGGATGAGFVRDGHLPSAPPADGAVGRPETWGSYTPADREAGIGQLTTGWYETPAELRGQELLVLVSGRLGEGNQARARYGQLRGGEVVEVGEQVLDDGADTPIWRQIPLQPPGGADVVRIEATDGTAGLGGWLAVSAPQVAEVRPLTGLIPRSATVAVSWQFAFLFPCAEQPSTVHGITEPSDWVIAWGDRGTAGLDDNVFTDGRGGLFHPTIRSATLTKLDAAMVEHPEVALLQVYRVDHPFPAVAYDLDRDRSVRWDWQGP
jgi:hypothetical protein